jgi:hypothetical protein
MVTLSLSVACLPAYSSFRRLPNRLFGPPPSSGRAR